MARRVLWWSSGAAAQGLCRKGARLMGGGDLQKVV